MDETRISISFNSFLDKFDFRPNEKMAASSNINPLHTSSDDQNDFKTIDKIIATYAEGKLDKINVYGVISFIQSKSPPPKESSKSRSSLYDLV